MLIIDVGSNLRLTPQSSESSLFTNANTGGWATGSGKAGAVPRDAISAVSLCPQTTEGAPPQALPISPTSLHANKSSNSLHQRPHPRSPLLQPPTLDDKLDLKSHRPLSVHKQPCVKSYVPILHSRVGRVSGPASTYLILAETAANVYPHRSISRPVNA